MSTRIAKWRVIVRKSIRINNVRFTFEGTKAPFKRETTKNGRRMFVVTIDMKGLKHGVYVARVKYRFVRRPGAPLSEAQRPSVPRRKVHYFRACYGNPKGGLGEGMNPYPVTLL